MAVLVIGGCSLEGLSGGDAPADGGAGNGNGGSAGLDASSDAGAGGTSGDSGADAAPKPSNEIWARRFGSASAEQEGTAIAMHPASCSNGCIAVGGYFTESVDFGGGALTTTTTPGDTDLFAAALEADGSHRWSFDFGDHREQRVRDLAVDAQGNLLITGFFRGSLEMGADQYGADPSWKNDVFVAKLGPNGSALWLRGFGGPISGADDNHQQADSIAIDASGNAYVTGTYSGLIAFDQEHDATDGQDIFVAKLDADGDVVWSKSWDGHSGNGALFAAVGEGGDLYLTGNFSTVLDLGCATALDTNSSNDDAFVARFDGAGQCKWARQFGSGSSTQIGRGLGVLPSGDVIVAFEIAGDISFGSDPLKGVGRDVVIARLASDDGDPVWALRAPDAGDQLPTDVAIDSDGAIVVVGTFSQSLTVPDGQTDATLLSNGESDFFVMRLLGDGTLDWLQGFGDIANDSARSVAIDPTGAIFVTGRFRGDVDFGKTMLTSDSGEGDIFIAKFARTAPK